MRNGQLVRVLQLASALEGRPRALWALAEEFRVSTRTIRRDLEALSLAGFQIRHTGGDTNRASGSWWSAGRSATGVEAA